MDKENQTAADRSRTWKQRLEDRGGRKVNVILEKPGSLALQALERIETDKTASQIVQEALVAQVRRVRGRP